MKSPEPDNLKTITGLPNYPFIYLYVILILLYQRRLTFMQISLSNFLLLLLLAKFIHMSYDYLQSKHLNPTLRMAWPSHHEKIWFEVRWWTYCHRKHGRWPGWCKLSVLCISAEGQSNGNDLPWVYKPLDGYLDLFTKGLFHYFLQ